MRHDSLSALKATIVTLIGVSPIPTLNIPWCNSRVLLSSVRNQAPLFTIHSLSPYYISIIIIHQIYTYIYTHFIHKYRHYPPKKPAANVHINIYSYIYSLHTVCTGRQKLCRLSLSCEKLRWVFHIHERNASIRCCRSSSHLTVATRTQTPFVYRNILYMCVIEIVGKIREATTSTVHSNKYRYISFPSNRSILLASHIHVARLHVHSNVSSLELRQRLRCDAKLKVENYVFKLNLNKLNNSFARFAVAVALTVCCVLCAVLCFQCKLHQCDVSS